MQVKHLFRLSFIDDKANALLLGGVGLGKTHLALEIGYEACLRGYFVLFSTAVDVINSLSSVQAAGQLKTCLKKYLKPALLILDELGYLPIDKRGADHGRRTATNFIQTGRADSHSTATRRVTLNSLRCKLPGVKGQWIVDGCCSTIISLKGFNTLVIYEKM